MQLWRETRFEVKRCKAQHVRNTFGSCDVEKVCLVARSIFRSQNAKALRMLGPLLQVEVLKSVCRCGAKHFSKSKCEKRTAFGPLLCTFKRRFVWQAQWVFAPCQKWVKHVDIQKRWQAWGIWKGFAKMRVAWQPQYTRHLQRCWGVRALISWETQATTPTTRTSRTAKRKRCWGGEDRGSSLERPIAVSAGQDQEWRLPPWDLHGTARQMHLQRQVGLAGVWKAYDGTVGPQSC